MCRFRSRLNAHRPARYLFSSKIDNWAEDRFSEIFSGIFSSELISMVKNLENPNSTNDSFPDPRSRAEIISIKYSNIFLKFTPLNLFRSAVHAWPRHLQPFFYQITFRWLCCIHFQLARVPRENSPEQPPSSRGDAMVERAENERVINLSTK